MFSRDKEMFPCEKIVFPCEKSTLDRWARCGNIRSEVHPMTETTPNEFEIWKADGDCIHGVYVGGCGVDYMCGLCEGGADVLVTYPRFTLSYRATPTAEPILIDRRYRAGHLETAYEKLIAGSPSSFTIDEDREYGWVRASEVGEMTDVEVIDLIIHYEDGQTYEERWDGVRYVRSRVG